MAKIEDISNIQICLQIYTRYANTLTNTNTFTHYHHPIATTTTTTYTYNYHHIILNANRSISMEGLIILWTISSQMVHSLYIRVKILCDLQYLNDSLVSGMPAVSAC